MTQNTSRPLVRARLQQSALRWLLLLPAVLSLLLLTYYPNFETIHYSLFNWDGGTVEEWRGIGNFKEILTADPLFWSSFGLIGILLVANLLKMWPSIFTAIVLHRLKSDRWSYIYRVLFVIPMVIPGLVGLLLWKSFFDANVGIFNIVLNATGLMSVLAWLDGAMPVASTFVATQLLGTGEQAWWQWLVTAPFKLVTVGFGGPWGVLLAGLVLLFITRGWTKARKFWLLTPLLVGGAIVCWGHGDLLTTVVRGAGVLAGLTLLVSSVTAQDEHLAPKRLRLIGWLTVVVALLLVLFTLVWPKPTGAFQFAHPAWLGNSKLVIPAVILWGFPWIGTIGVLIYLAGLQNISKEVYEAAELDGIGFWGKIFRLEIPLIMSQVRINLIFMTIGTLTDYGFFLILLGPSGGPGNAGMVPGLYLYQQAFVESRMGYACALGMALFVVILYLTVVYQRHVTVEK